MRSRLAVLAGFVLVAVSACGGAERAADPTLPGAVAERLAVQSDAVARDLDAGDGCAALLRLDRLQKAAERAIAAGGVPVAFRAELRDTIAALGSEITCDPPAPPPAVTTTQVGDTNADRGEDQGKPDERNDKGKGHDNENGQGKGKGHGGGDG
jgi:hypothetical protein